MSTASVSSEAASAAAALSRARWDAPAGQALRRARRERKIRELLASFPVTEAEAELYRALLASGGKS